MILFVILAILLIAQVITYFLNRQKIKKINDEISKEHEKLKVIPNFKKKSVLVYVVAFLLTALVYFFPVTLNIVLHMHFSSKMFLGKLNLIFTFVLSFSAFIVVDIIQNKILQSYVIEYKQKNPDINPSDLPDINIKKIFIVDLLNIFTSVISVVLVIILFILR